MVDILVDQLLQSKQPGIPPDVEALGNAEYAHVALAYIDSYRFHRPFHRYLRTKLTRMSDKAIEPDEKSRRSWRALLRALVELDRTIFRALDSALDPDAAKRAFIRSEIFEKREELEEQGSRYWALIEHIQARTTPITTPEDRNCAVKNNVKQRDNYRCRVSGFHAWNSKDDAHVKPESEPLTNQRAILEVAHGISYKTSGDAWRMLQAITGTSFDNRVADSEGNTVLFHNYIHMALRRYMIYLEKNSNDELVVHYRTQPSQANPSELFKNISSPRRNRQPPLVADGDTLRSVPSSNIPDIDYKFFAVHKAIGDVIWMVTAAVPEILARLYDDDDDDDDTTAVLSDDNFHLLDERLDQVAKQQQNH